MSAGALVRDAPLVVVVGSGGVGKTTVAASLGLLSAGEGTDTLVMTFDPSLRLKDALGVGGEALDREIEVPAGLPGRLAASLLDPRGTFDRLVARYAPDAAARDRILHNRFYRNLAGSLAGVLEYMAVERLYEVALEGTHGRIVLDTPPTRQALDFLEAPSRIVGFLDSGALRIALRPWFDERGHLRPASALGPLGRSLEGWLDRLVGLDLLRDMAEFFQAFEPLYEGFRRRATEVEALLRSERTLFVLVSGPGEERIADTMFLARQLVERGYRLGPIVVNRLHPPELAGDTAPADPDDGEALIGWLARRDGEALRQLRDLVGASRPVHAVPLLDAEPTDIPGLAGLADHLVPPWGPSPPPGPGP
ncbi:MAG: ArsA family ATPase [Acidobacteriota bacterium]